MRRWHPRRWRAATSSPAAILQQPVAEAAAGAVAGTETVDNLDRNRWHGDRFAPRAAEHAVGSLLDDRQLDTEVQQGVGGAKRVSFAHRDLYLFEVAHRDGDIRQRHADMFLRGFI